VFVAAVVAAAIAIRPATEPSPASEAPAPPPVAYRDDAHGYSVAVPAGWEVADRPINTWVSDPQEILAMATYPLRAGGEAVVDFQLPSRAVEDLGPSDLLIWLNDAGSAKSFPPRPDRFEPSRPCEGWTKLCSEPTGRTVWAGDDRAPDMRGWWLGFADSGRGFYVFVGMGEQAYDDPARAQQAWDILDSLSFDSTPKPATPSAAS
jgi:hypothetical protein